MGRSPLFKRLKEEEVQKALDALNCLRLLGMESIESVTSTIDDLCEMTDAKKAAACQVAAAETECSAENKEVSAKLMQTVSILKQSLLEKAATEFTVEMADSCTSDFQEVVVATKQFDEENLLDSSSSIKYVEFPTTTSVDSFRGTTTSRQVLMTVSQSVKSRSGDKQAELIVNLMCEGPSKNYQTYSVITSQGEMVGLSNMNGHTRIAAAQAVQRSNSLQEAILAFKMQLFTVAEHLANEVIDKEFVEVEEIVPLTPTSNFESACETDSCVSYQDAGDALLTPLGGGIEPAWI
eukprot:TRINITY_DN3113_c0_g1_i2.p1 TRINITY_DN3113_c0_g1~~TRINITY_DN3113_c0_g1_i2.p1  ORF type:complete len:308 (+),score=83.76 TRINITY_DN3113_c0_g1_i2:43-924(+)